ncbi:MAG: hypothetical protein IPK59_17935 [Rhodospirillaceae bacterium]|nr:hypothetical protein [Rhodospirillaceae bacterium]
MSDFLNPLGGRFIGPSGPVGTSAVMGTVPDPPRGFRLLDPGTIIKGVVLGRESDGLTAIATDKGTIRVASNVTLPVGTQVTLEVRPTGDRLQVLILANDAAQHQPQTQPQQTSASGQGTQAMPTGPYPPGGGGHGSEARASGQQATPPAVTPRADPPSIQVAGSSLRAVVVHAPPPQALQVQALQAEAPQAQPSQAQPSQAPAPQAQSSQAQAPQAQAPQAQAPQAQPPQVQPPQAPAPQPLPPQPLPPQAQSPQAQPPQAQPPQAQSPQAQPPQAGTPAPAQPAPQSPPPTPLPPTTASAAPQVPTQPATPPTTTLPATTQPAATPPAVTQPGTAPATTTTVTAPVTSPPQGQPPVPPGIVLPNVPGPSAIPNLATTQAALIAAMAEKKDRPPTTTATAATPRAGAAALPNMAPLGQSTAHMPPAATGAAQAAATTSTSPQQIPANSALSADTRLRILALFASASATAEHSQHAATDEVQSPQQPISAKHPALPLPLGAELKLRVLAVQMQAHQQIEIDPIAQDPDGNGQVIFGRVVAITPAGHAVIHTPIGDIMLQDRSSLPLGARLALSIDTLETAPPPAAIAAPIVQTPQQALLTLAQGWPTLAELIAIFRGTAAHPGQPGGVDPEIARQALGLLPQAGNKLGAGMMNAMAALRASDLGKLLGPLFTSKGAGPEREEMVRRLKGEFAQLSALAQDRPEVDWRALFLPVIDDQGRVTQINLFYRHPKKDEGADRPGGGTGTRFVVEADFSRLGPFQLDGLMRQQRFDLMIRSRTRLTDRMRREIEAIYEEARGLTGFSGSIAFQTVDEFPVIPLDDLKRGTPTVMV